jgi:hypothetical protein
VSVGEKSEEGGVGNDDLSNEGLAQIFEKYYTFFHA